MKLDVPKAPKKVPEPTATVHVLLYLRRGDARVSEVCCMCVED